MSYQKCPLCNGRGIIENSYCESSKDNTCSVCNGAKIISQLTGLPPVKINDEYLKLQ